MAGYRYLDLITEVETLCNITDQRAMVKRLVNHGLAAIAASYDWPQYWTESFLTTVAEYTTGTITVTNGSAIITGSSTTFPTGAAGRKIRVSGEQAYYVIKSRDSATQLTLYQPYQGTTASGKSYSLFQDVFLLASDMDKQKLIRQIEGGITLLSKHVSDFDVGVPTPSATGSASWEIKVGRNDQRVFPNYSTGTVSMSSGSRTLTGSGTSWTSATGVGKGTKLQIGTTLYTVKSVDSDTQITTYESASSVITAGTAYVALLDNAMVELYNIPNVVENYYYRYQRLPAVLDADQDYPDLMAPLHPLIIRWCMPWMWESKGFMDRAQAARKWYFEELKQAQLHYGQDHLDRVYQRKPSGIGWRDPTVQISNVGIPLR